MDNPPINLIKDLLDDYLVCFDLIIRLFGKLKSFSLSES